jgi:hypothetical protein
MGFTEAASDDGTIQVVIGGLLVFAPGILIGSA